MSLRLRLTVLYGVCFLTAGAALLGITYVLFAHSQDRVRSAVTQRRVVLPSTVRPMTLAIRPVPAAVATARAPAIRPVGSATRATGSASAGAGSSTRTRTGTAPELKTTVPLAVAVAKVSLSDQKSAQRQVTALVRQANLIIQTQHARSTSSLLIWSAVALAVMALLSVLLGFLIAGRALSPLRTMNQRARAITAENLDQRLGLEVRNDELGDLARTFDALLGRLESSFEAQRRFVANASHELRTPITLERALVEVALADPDASVSSLRRVCERVLVASESQEHLIEALLALARGQAGATTLSPCDLGELTRTLLDERRSQTAGFVIGQDLAPATVSADRRLLERLIANLLDNAIVHNTTDGWLRIHTGHDDERRPFLSVANGGTVITADQVEALAEPFRRLAGERTGDGLGLGLSIATAIATAHGAELVLSPGSAGGLVATVSFQSTAAIQSKEPHSLRPDAFAVLRARF